MNSIIIDILAVLIIYQSIVFIITLLINKNSKSVFVTVLIGICLLLICHFCYIIYNNHVENNLFLGPVFGLLYGPFYYIYTQSLILKSFDIKRHLYHLFPAFVILLILIFATPKSIFTIDLIVIVVIIQFIIYLICSIRHIYNYRQLLKDNISTFHEISLFWLEFILYFQILIILIVLIENFYQSLLPSNGLIALIFGLTLLLINCLYYLGLKQVHLFKGLEHSQELKQPLQQYEISSDLFDKYLQLLITHMQIEKPYLEFDLSIQDLSERLNISARNLSHVINRHYNQNFYDFINHYRLLRVKRELTTTDKPIKEIMYESGFSNKATFNSIFKKSIGTTPTLFRKNKK